MQDIAQAGGTIVGVLLVPPLSTVKEMLNSIRPVIVLVAGYPGTAPKTGKRRMTEKNPEFPNNGDRKPLTLKKWAQDQNIPYTKAIRLRDSGEIEKLGFVAVKTKVNERFRTMVYARHSRALIYIRKTRNTTPREESLRLEQLKTFAEQNFYVIQDVVIETAEPFLTNYSVLYQKLDELKIETLIVGSLEELSFLDSTFIRLSVESQGRQLACANLKRSDAEVLDDIADTTMQLLLRARRLPGANNFEVARLEDIIASRY